METGTKLGPYEIREQLGAGGMGEVWLAEDTRLGRTVAIKVLPSEFASDPERLARFEQEARAAAALNHPHIAVVHDIGAEDGLHYMVQEHLRGRTLREALTKGALPLGEALALATEIAEALNAAHKAGIVHRDLKPDNVFVSDDGHAKVLDFGLAKLTEISQGMRGSASMSPTMLGTQTGVIMGTAGYMAPEQVQGEAVDGRTDLFAFGCLLYEMVSGQRAFSGQSLVQTLNRIAHEEPAALGSLDAALPAELQRIVGKCLAKSPARRYQAAADLVVDLMALASEVESGRGVSPRPAVETSSVPSGGGLSFASLAAGVLLGAALVAAGIWYSTRPSPQPLTRLSVTLTAPDYGIPGPPLIAISPDGRTVIYTGPDQLYRRDLEHLQAEAIPGTEGANTPFFSPDGRWLGFQDDRGLGKISLAGGPTVRLCDGPVRGAHWGANDIIVFGSLADGLVRVPGRGGECTALTTRDGGDPTHWRPHMLPDGKHVIFTVWTGSVETAQLAVVDMAAGEQRLLGIGGTFPHYVDSGHLVFARQGSLWAVRFDAVRAEAIGTPVPVVDSVRVEVSGASQYSIADDGTLLYMPGDLMSGERQLVWVDREGKESALSAPPRSYRDPVISPDGKRIAVSVDEAAGTGSNVYVWDTDREALTRLTFDGSNDTPLWSRDGSTLTFRSDRDGGAVLQRAASGAGAVELLAETQSTPWSWSPNGVLVLSWQDSIQLWSAGSTTPVELALGEGAARPVLSPDGRWIAYQTNRTGNQNVFVRPFPAVDQGLWQISTGDIATEPKWSADGQELYFLANQAVMVSRIGTEPTFVASPPQKVFDMRYFRGNSPRRYAISPDGSRLLMITYVSGAEAADSRLPGMILVQNWVNELERLVPESR